ncbi:uncharacterized protein LOC143043596 [Mytilus galloprovincialis]|uniref:uncharacterized protein LOC143043596 n=1 Tax=Mytilus galloprovincialis TaxID=29158 RepID=UPI003F7CCCD2
MMNVSSIFIIILSLCKVDMTLNEIKHYYPGEDVILQCKRNTASTTFKWLFKNEVVSDGYKLNTKGNNSSKYEITKEKHLRIQNGSISDEGKYTCLSIPPFEGGIHTVILKIQHRITIVQTPMAERKDTTAEIEVNKIQNTTNKDVKAQNISYVCIYIVCCCGCSLMFCASGFVFQEWKRVKERDNTRKKVQMMVEK